MHVVHLYDGHEAVYDGRGSVPEVVWNIARETAATGHDVTVVERQWDGLPSAEERHHVTFKRINMRTGADEPWERVPYEMVHSVTGLMRLVSDRTNFALAALRTLHRIDFDVLHVHLPFAANVLVTLAPGLRDRIVYTAHLGELRMNAVGRSDEFESNTANDNSIEIPRALRLVSPDRYLARRAKRVVTLNSRIRQLFQEQGVSPSKLIVIPNGVDFNRFNKVDTDVTDAVADKYEIEASTVLLFVGTIMPRKGVRELVQAFGRVLAETKDDVTLLIAGENHLDDAYTNSVHEEIRTAAMQDRVELLGFVPHEELPGLYALADAFVMPSLEEGFGMTVVEAMAAGTPVISTKVGGIDRVVESGVHGLLVNPGDVRGLTEAINCLIASQEKREQMGKRAETRARTFAWNRIGQQYISTYEELCE